MTARPIAPSRAQFPHHLPASCTSEDTTEVNLAAEGALPASPLSPYMALHQVTKQWVSHNNTCLGAIRV